MADRAGEERGGGLGVNKAYVEVRLSRHSSSHDITDRVHAGADGGDVGVALHPGLDEAGRRARGQLNLVVPLLETETEGFTAFCKQVVDERHIEMSEASPHKRQSHDCAQGCAMMCSGTRDGTGTMRLQTLPEGHM